MGSRVCEDFFQLNSHLLACAERTDEEILRACSSSSSSPLQGRMSLGMFKKKTFAPEEFFPFHMFLNIKGN